MIGYKESRSVFVFSGEGQTLGDELRFHIMAPDDDLHARFQIKNPAIRLYRKKGDNELRGLTGQTDKDQRPKGCQVKYHPSHIELLPPV